MKKEYFAAMNSYGGFVSHYRDCFAQERRYIIKGGPGCGKSTLMRRIAREAEQRGLEVEYYDCSSDPGSLDGIVLPSLGIAMFDGTAPHEEAASAPGWRDNLIDLGAYWDSKALREHQDEIIPLSEKKTEAYHGAYRYLGMAGTASLLRLELLGDCIDAKALESTAKQLARKIITAYASKKTADTAQSGKRRRRCGTAKVKGCESISREITESAGKERKNTKGNASAQLKTACDTEICIPPFCAEIPNAAQVIVGALGMDGYVYRPTLEQDAETVIALRDCHGVAALLLEALSRLLTVYGIPHTVGLDAPSGDACVLRAGNTAVTLREDIAHERGVRMLGCRKLLCTDEATERALCELDSAAKTFTELAAERLSEAREAHFELERIYGETMDYASIDSLCGSLIEQLLPAPSRSRKKQARRQSKKI